jgi:hypothetical protein
MEKQHTWRRLQVEGRKIDETQAAFSITLQCENRQYVVSVQSANPLSVSDALNAMRAACAHAVHHFGGDPKQIGGVERVVEVYDGGAANAG